ncbi:CYTH-like domain-containing protein [Limtongia smithiae]|uniref:CYTH-like domain-containing protein n=1 Tax=Limtongia smithiae TaxID=1125753 RepID=UPI0034CE93EB
MDLRSIINTESSNAAASAAPPQQNTYSTTSVTNPSTYATTALVPLAPPPPPAVIRRGSSIADLVDPPGTPPQISSPTVYTTPNMLSSAVSAAAVAAAASASRSPLLLTRPMLATARSRSMSISNLTDDGSGYTNMSSPSSSRRASPTMTTATISNGSRPMGNTNMAANKEVGTSPSTSNVSSPEVHARHHAAPTVPSTNASTSPRQQQQAQKPIPSENTPKPRKPRRYNTPPIYARQWRPDWQAAYNGNGNGPNSNSGSHSRAQESRLTQEIAGAANKLSQDNIKVSSTLPASTANMTFTNVEPYEDLTRRVSSWIYANVVGMPPETQAQIEVEAKVGLILSKATQQRLVLPVDTEVLLNMDMLSGQVNFESDVSAVQFQAYNEFMNDCLHKSERWPLPIKYEHKRTRDEFYTVRPPPGAFNAPSSRHESRVRVSIDARTDEVVSQIIKTRVRDLMIHCPGSKFDIRISLNIEKPGKRETQNMKADLGC